MIACGCKWRFLGDRTLCGFQVFKEFILCLGIESGTDLNIGAILVFAQDRSACLNLFRGKADGSDHRSCTVRSQVYKENYEKDHSQTEEKSVNMLLTGEVAAQEVKHIIHNVVSVVLILVR